MKLRNLEKSKPSAVGIKPGTALLLDKTQRSGEADLYEKGQSKPPLPPTNVPTQGGSGVVAQALLGCFRRHPRAVGAVVAALMLPGLLAPLPGPSLIEADTSQSATVAEHVLPAVDARVVAALNVAVPDLQGSALAAYVAEIKQSLAAVGLPTTAEGIRISVISREGSARADLVRALGHEQFGMAPGADIHLVDLGAQSFNARHEALAQALEQQTALVRQGHAPTNEWFATAIAVELFESAQAVRGMHQSKQGTQTEVAVLAHSSSPRSVAQRLLEHLKAAPEDSEAAKYLADLPVANADGSSVDLWQGLTRRILDVMDTESGGRRINEGKRALRAQYGEAREKGVLVFRPSGDLRRTGDEESHRSGRDFSDGFEAPIAVGATALPSGNGPPVILDATSTGWMALAGPGVPVPSPNLVPLDGSAAAAAHVAGIAALMLKLAPELGPDQLETLLTNPRVLLDQPGTRDGLGFVQAPNAVELAALASKGQVQFSTDRSRFLFEKVVKGGPEITDSHPYVQHIDHLRAMLTERGLPTRADGVKVFVVEPGWDDHVGAVSRTIAHPRVGLAPGADVRVIVDSEWYSERERALSKADVAHDDAVLAGAVPTVQSVINTAERQILSRAADIRKVASLAPGDETVLLNMSYGTTSASIADDLVDLMESAPKGSPAGLKVEGLGGTRSERERAMTEWVAEVLGSSEAKAQIASALEALANELRAAREKGVLAFTSAGNAREAWMQTPLQSAHVEAGLDDLITVSAMRINDPKKLGDESPTDFTSEGHVIFGAPGEGMPIGLRGDAKGTSFASPYGLSTAALMLAANPKLTPDQLELLIYQPSSTFNIPGHLDGLGVIDVVGAVGAAAEAKAPGFVWLSQSQHFELRKIRLEGAISVEWPKTDGS